MVTFQIEQGDFTIVTIDDVTRIRWTPPTGIGMVKFYSVILSKLDTNIAEWTLANDQVLDIEIDLGTLQNALLSVIFYFRPLYSISIGLLGSD